jgi:hypothetical protein
LLAIVKPLRLLLPLVLVLALFGALLPAGVATAKPSLSWWEASADEASAGEVGDAAVGGHAVPSGDAMPWCGAAGPEDVDGRAIAQSLPSGRHAIAASRPVSGMAPHPPGPRFPTGPPILT